MFKGPQVGFRGFDFRDLRSVSWSFRGSRGGVSGDLRVFQGGFREVSGTTQKLSES